MAEFVIPDFLQNVDVDTIHKKMMSMLPADIDSTEGGFPWDFTRPTALITSELLQFYAVQLLKMIFVQYATGEYLELHAEAHDIVRKEATYATVELVITGTPGSMIPAESVFCTERVNDKASIEFKVADETVIDYTGSVTVEATAVATGPDSNVDANTVTVMYSPIYGIESVTNPEKAIGGTTAESDDDLRERVLEAIRAGKQSNVGNDSDYRRWAESVPGIGYAYVQSCWNGPNTIRIICVDDNGDAASQTLLDAVYDYIFSPDDPSARLAPTTAQITVVAPAIINVAYSFNLELRSGYTAENVEDAFKEALVDLYAEARSEGELKYTRVAALLSGLDGVDDFSNLLMNGTTSNIDVSQIQFLSTATVTITVV